LQISVMEVDGPDISKYGVVVPNGAGAGIVGVVAKPDASDVPSNLASIGQYVLTPDIFDSLRGLKAGSGGGIQLADAINLHAKQGSVETVRLNGRRFDCGSVDGFMLASVCELQKRLEH
jgi:UTP--glucose-1-phosphate uridylyltransferase